MREISQKIREKTVKLFLEGDTYDEIAWELGISKGSVVNIINEFREGDLSLSGDMTEYVDELRRIVVDLKKREITIGQMRALLGLHNRLRELVEYDEEIEGWLNSFHEILDWEFGCGDPAPASTESTMLSPEPEKFLIARRRE